MRPGQVSSSGAQLAAVLKAVMSRLAPRYYVCNSLPIGKDIMGGKESMPTSTLTSKGQITIPKELRDQLHLKKGSRLEFVVDASGRVILQPLNSDFRSLRGMIRSNRRRPVSIEEMNKAIPAPYSCT